MKNILKLCCKCFFATLIIFFVSCNSKETFLNKFKKTINIKHQTIQLKNNTFFSKVWNLYLSNDCLIAYDVDEKYYFSIIDLNKKSIVAKCGVKGQGPNEIIGMPQSVKILGNNRFSFIDCNRGALYYVDFSTATRPKIIKNDMLKLSFKHFGVLPTAYNNYLIIGLLDNGRYSLVDQNGKEISNHFDYPRSTETEKFTNYHKAMAFQGSFIGRPDGIRFFFTGKTSEIIDILEIDNKNGIKKIFNWQGKLARFLPFGDGNNTISVATSKESNNVFINACCTQKYIYLLYSGLPIGNQMIYRSNTVFVLDWDGNPVKKYNLDIGVTCITVSDENKELYAISEQSDTQLVKFNLH